MRPVVLVLAAFVWTATASGVEQFHIEFKLYRTTVPDEERAAKEQTVRSTPETGLIEGDYINSDVGFFEDDGQLVYRPAGTDKEIRYELISSPRITTMEEKEATIRIGEEVPYKKMEKDDQGQSIAVTKYKDVGTTVRVLVSNPSDSGASIETDGKFVTVVGQKQIATRDSDGSVTVEPILETTTWNREGPVLYGTWLFQRIKVTLGHEFLVFARVTRFDPEAETKREQYSVELKLLRMPETITANVREHFAYDDSAEISGDEARVFSIGSPDASEPATFSEFLTNLNSQHDVELLTAPRITVGTGNSLYKLVVRNPQSYLGDAPTPGPGKPAVSGVEQFMEHSPITAKFLREGGPNLGVLSDATFYKDPADGSVLGFDGFQIGVQIDPPANPADDALGLNLVFHHQFNTGGREKKFLRKAEPYTFSDQTFRLSDYDVTDGVGFGIEFTSKQTGDAMYLLVEIDVIDPSGPRFFASDLQPLSGTRSSAGTQAPAAILPSTFKESSSSIAISEDIDIVLDIVPQIVGERVRLQAMAFQAGPDRERALSWANVTLGKEDAVTLGFDFDDAENVAQVLGTRSFPKKAGVVPQPVVGRPFHGAAIPRHIDVVAWIGPRIQEGGIRLWMDIAETKDLAAQPDGQRVWTNVIVRDGDGVVLGQEPNRGWSLLGIRSGSATVD